MAEEETCDDLLLFMKMLSHLTTKDFLDFGGVSGQEVGVSPADVVITGVQIIIPLMTEDILKVRNRFAVSAKWYQLALCVCLRTRICTVYPSLGSAQSSGQSK